MNKQQALQEIEQGWAGPRWTGVERTYTAEDVYNLRGSVHIEHSLAQQGAAKLWDLVNSDGHVAALGALTGNQAVQMAQAGLKAIYLSGWQVAADANTSGQMYPDQSLYPANSVPQIVRNINNALLRADQVAHSEGADTTDWMLPIVADAEAGFGGSLNAFELMKGMIEAGAAGVHFEDQLSSAKKCGHMGGKVLVPTREAIQKLVAARLAADVLGVPTVLVARTDANGAQLLTSDCDPVDAPFCTGERTVEGFFRIAGGLDVAIARGLAYAPYCDLIWCETSEPNFEEAERFANAIHAKFPGKLLAYNCSPSFNWKQKLSDAEIASFQKRLGEMGYKFHFVTLAGFHALNLSMFELATSALSARATSISCRRSSRAARPRPTPWKARRKKSSSSRSWLARTNSLTNHGRVISTGGLKGRSGETPVLRDVCRAEYAHARPHCWYKRNTGVSPLRFAPVEMTHLSYR